MNIQYVICIALIILLVIVCLIIKNIHNKENYEVTAGKILSGTVQTGKDIANYAKEKWVQLKNYLKKHYREAMIRKMFKFLNNSGLKYLGPDQDFAKNEFLKQRMLYTEAGKPTLLQRFCVLSKENKEKSKMWLINLMKMNFNDYLHEQWKLKSTLKRAILALGENFGFMSGEDILNKYILEIINEDFDGIITALNAFENKEGVNVCAGKKKSILSKLFS